MQGYDIIGDIHGHADALEALLTKLGYRIRNGVWRHPSRRAVFVGDLIDGGPRQRDVIDIVRRMRDADAADVTMGNHEFNAIGWATEHRTRPGRYLRIRGSKNEAQHRAFLEAVGNDSPLHKELVAWFTTLPLWKEYPDFRVVHACWHPEHQKILRAHLRPDNTLTEDGVHAVYEKGTAPYEAAEVVLKGLEIPLPEGVSFHDKDGHVRRNTRIRWWDTDAMTYRSSALVDPDTAACLPDEPLPATSRLIYDDQKPVFFGHYWMQGEPILVSDRKVCLDFSVAKDGVLCAYRHDGEDVLTPDKLAWVHP